MKNLYIIATILFISSVSFSQSPFKTKFKKGEKEFQLLERDISFIYDSFDQEFTFKRVKGDKIIVTETKQFTILNTRYTNASVFLSEYTDDQTTIKRIKYYPKIAKKKAYSMTYFCAGNLSESIFSSDFKQCHTEHLIKKRDGVKFQVQKQYNDVKYLTRVFFNSNYPSLKKTIKIHVPKWLQLELKEFNFRGYNIKKSESKSGEITTYEFNVETIDALPNENLAPPLTYTAPHLTFIFKSFTSKGGTEKTILASTKDLYNWYKKLINDVPNQSDTLRTLTNKLIEGKKTDLEKIESIYYWIQDNIRYIAFEDGIMGFKPESCQRVFANRYGDCKGMANLSKQMLKIAGFDARLTWIGTTHISPQYDYSFASLANDNHMICSLDLEGTRYFIDPTEKKASLGINAARIQGKKVLIEDGDNFIIEMVPEVSFSKNLHSFDRTLQLVDDKLIGQVKLEFFGEENTGMHQALYSLRSQHKDDVIRQYLSKRNPEITVSDIRSSGTENRNENIRFDYSVQIENKVQEGKNGLIYINLNGDNDLSNFNLSSHRKSGLFFANTFNKKKITSFSIPSRYSAEEIPAPFKFENKYYSLSGEYTREGNILILKKEISIKKKLIPHNKVKEFQSKCNQFFTFYNRHFILKPI